MTLPCPSAPSPACSPSLLSPLSCRASPGESASPAFPAPVSLPISIIAHQYPKSNLQIQMGPEAGTRKKRPFFLEGEMGLGGWGRVGGAGRDRDGEREGSTRSQRQRTEGAKPVFSPSVQCSLYSCLSSGSDLRPARCLGGSGAGVREETFLPITAKPPGEMLRQRQE